MDALDAAEKLKFSFDQEGVLDLRTYMTKKVNLLEEAEIYDEDQIVRQVWRDLDPAITATVTIKTHGNRLDDFMRKLYQHEFAAKRWHDQLRQQKKSGDIR